MDISIDNVRRLIMIVAYSRFYEWRSFSYGRAKLIHFSSFCKTVIVNLRKTV